MKAGGNSYWTHTRKCCSVKGNIKSLWWNKTKGWKISGLSLERALETRSVNLWGVWQCRVWDRGNDAKWYDLLLCWAIFSAVDLAFKLNLLLKQPAGQGTLNTQKISPVTAERAWLMFQWGRGEVSGLKTWLWKHCTGRLDDIITNMTLEFGEYWSSWWSLISQGLIWEVLYNGTALGWASNPNRWVGSGVISIIVVIERPGKGQPKCEATFWRGQMTW